MNYATGSKIDIFTSDTSRDSIPKHYVDRNKKTVKLSNLTKNYQEFEEMIKRDLPHEKDEKRYAMISAEASDLLEKYDLPNDYSMFWDRNGVDLSESDPKKFVKIMTELESHYAESKLKYADRSLFDDYKIVPISEQNYLNNRDNLIKIYIKTDEDNKQIQFLSLYFPKFKKWYRRRKNLLNALNDYVAYVYQNTPTVARGMSKAEFRRAKRKGHFAPDPKKTGTRDKQKVFIQKHKGVPYLYFTSSIKVARSYAKRNSDGVLVIFKKDLFGDDLIAPRFSFTGNPDAGPYDEIHLRFAQIQELRLICRVPFDVARIKWEDP